jgi:hypothetical protein
LPAGKSHANGNSNHYGYCDGNSNSYNTASIADANSYCGAKTYADGQAASHTSDSSLRAAFSGRFFRGLASDRESPKCVRALRDYSARPKVT